MERIDTCEKCKSKHIEDSGNWVETKPKQDDQFQEYLIYFKCPNCDHCQDYIECHTCVATSHYIGESWCGWCDRDMTPSSYYI